MHRDAIPFLAALSLVASASVAAVRHVFAWARRAIGRLVAHVPRVVALRLRLFAARQTVLAARARFASLGARAPPSTLLVLPATCFAGIRSNKEMHV